MRAGEPAGEGIRKSERGAVAATLLASLLFASQYVVIKTGLGSFDPLMFGAMTMTVGGLLAFLVVHRRRGVDRRIFRHWEVWAGALISVVMISCQYIGLTMTSASVGGLIVGSNIIFVVPLSVVLFREPLGRGRAIGLALGLLGLVTITTGWDADSLDTGMFMGDLLLLVASFCIAANYPMTKLAVRHMGYDEWIMAFHLLSIAPLLALSLLAGGSYGADQGVALAALYVGLLCTSLPTMLWARGLRSITMATSATVLLSESVFAVIFGIILLGEPADLHTIAGAVLVFAAIFLVAYRPRGPTARPGER
ncbi:DMT family transporter [Methanomassiliicoccus luminyensis]|uniref:DMT family transporter n=1 Tax=Methanomassiliicoccus luminyensis TaxID=1080712 RepID=UPI00037E5575|nr:DMT family transporter [Methanomassiliicoccus luminyensis]